MRDELRTQHEANNTWSVYFGEGFVKGGFQTREQAQKWLDDNREYFGR